MGFWNERFGLPDIEEAVLLSSSPATMSLAILSVGTQGKMVRPRCFLVTKTQQMEKSFALGAVRDAARIVTLCHFGRYPSHVRCQQTTFLGSTACSVESKATCKVAHQEMSGASSKCCAAHSQCAVYICSAVKYADTLLGRLNCRLNYFFF